MIDNFLKILNYSSSKYYGSNFIKFLTIFLIIFFNIFYSNILFASNNSNNKIHEKTLIWAADAEGNAPYIFQNPDNPTENMGFECDIIEAIAETMGRTPIFFQNQWDGLIPGLERNDYDLVCNGIEITEDRKLEINFSKPYYITYLQLVVRRDCDDIKSFEDLHGKPVGALKGSLAERVLGDSPGLDIRTYEGEVYSFADLENGRLEACLVDAPIALYYASWNPQLKLVGKPVEEMAYGIAIRKKDTALLREVNTAIDEMIVSGKLRQILDNWNLWNYKMAIYTNDKSVSFINSERFEEFVRIQKKELGFESIFKRYTGFIPLLAQAAGITVGLSVLSMLLAIILGLIIAIVRAYAPFPFSSLAVLYIEIIRGTPLLIQLFIIFYALPTIGIKLTPFFAAIIGLGCNYAAYEAENYRAGLFSVPRGQIEAAVSLGMNAAQAFRHVVFPQALRIIFPPITNDFISLLKDSSLVSVITMVELTKVYNQIASTYYDYLWTGLIVAVIYLLLGLPFVRLSRYAERRFAVDYRKKL